MTTDEPLDQAGLSWERLRRPSASRHRWASPDCGSPCLMVSGQTPPNGYYPLAQKPTGPRAIDCQIGGERESWMRSQAIRILGHPGNSVFLVGVLGAPGSPGYVWSPKYHFSSPSACSGLSDPCTGREGLWEYPHGVCLMGPANKAAVALTAFSSPERPSSDPQDLEKHRERAPMLGSWGSGWALGGGRLGGA